MMQMRLLTTGHRSAAENMAIDEAVLTEIAAGRSLPTLRFYGWKPAAISIGYFQSLAEEIDLDACKAQGVAYVRRITGGGAVLHEHEITYSIHLPEPTLISAEAVKSTPGGAGMPAFVPPGILESYGKICGGVVRGCELLGIKTQFVALNDIVTQGTPVHAGGRKISGNAQTRREGVILQHGTVLLHVDVEKMFSLLKVPSEKMKGKLIQDIKQRVTSLSDVAGREISFDEARVALHGGFAAEFSGVEFVPGELTQNEKTLAEKFKKEKYESDIWNAKR